ncbi:hypothetical protein DPEC_G00140580 [Dallia pectoralis]|uniref:Uncharacterized protein n=1 Tax=Dallia pectoralis TaxID=75939 RepID=A0ACC2GN07_DALPE|nr:hypothetical protein DPEC_G00140580 [Dallia pectoralis]
MHKQVVSINQVCAPHRPKICWRIYRQTDEMTSPTSEKIVLLIGTSTVSLNERFTAILKNELQEPVDVEVLSQQQAASIANRKLALEMENRASVQAALQPRSPKLRLGTCTVLRRLGRPKGSLMRGRTRSRRWAVGRLRGMNRRRFKVLGNIQRGFFRKVSLYRGVNRMHTWAGANKRMLLQGLQGSQPASPGVRVSRGAKNGLRGRGRGERLSQRGRGRFQGYGRGMGRPGKVPSKEELDNQLDDYMSMSKTRLDADLDSYMAMAGSDYMA